MKHQNLSFLFRSLFIVIALALSLFNTIPVFADDATPPAPTEEPAQPPTEQPVITSTEEAVTIAEPVADATETVNLPEVLDQLPEETTVAVIVDGQVEPLATQDAANAIVSGDPVWCPATLAAPTPGANGCTASDSSLQSLLNTLAAAQPNQAGIIWIASSYNSNLNDAASTEFIIDGTTLATMSNSALTIQGGWSGISGDATIGAASTFYDDSFAVLYWKNDVTINNILIDYSGTLNDTGLDVTSLGDVALNNVSVTHSSDDGASIQTLGDITVSNSTFDRNYYGLDASSIEGNITLDNVTANQNVVGANLEATGNVAVTQGTFNNNEGDGLIARSYNNAVTLNNVTANGNLESGAYVEGHNAVEINNSTFSDNILDGVQVKSFNGSITLANVIANGNGANGAYVKNDYTGNSSNITISDSTFGGSGNGNYLYGLAAYSNGNITLSKVTANDNIWSGAFLENDYEGNSSNITISDSTFGGSGNGNWQFGLLVYSNGYIDLRSVTASDNDWGGAYLGTGGDATVVCSQFNDNGNNGIDGGLVSGTFTLNDVTFSGNGADYSGSPVITSGGCSPTSGANGGSGGDHRGAGQENALYIIIPQIQDQLPGALADGNTFASALKVILTELGEKTPDLQITLSFPIPDGMKDAKLAVMFWDGSKWIAVSGGSVINGFFVVTVNTPGTYVLVGQ